MLNASIDRKSKRFLTFLFFISVVTFQSQVFGEPKEETASHYRELGYAAQQKGDLNEALTYYNKAIALGVENPVVYNDIGTIYEQIGLAEKAQGFYLKALTLDKNYLPTYMNLAYLYQSLGDREQAFKLFKKRYELSTPGDKWGERAKEELLKIHPEFQSWIDEREAEQMQKAMDQQAQKEFEDKVARANDHYKQGMDFLKKEDLKNAMAEFNLALSLTPNNPKVLKAKEEVVRQLTADQIRQQADLAIKKINSGDAYSAKFEIQKMLSTIPDESMMKSDR